MSSTIEDFVQGITSWSSDESSSAQVRFAPFQPQGSGVLHQIEDPGQGLGLLFGGQGFGLESLRDS